MRWEGSITIDRQAHSATRVARPPFFHLLSFLSLSTLTALARGRRQNITYQEWTSADEGSRGWWASRWWANTIRASGYAGGQHQKNTHTSHCTKQEQPSVPGSVPLSTEVPGPLTYRNSAGSSPLKAHSMLGGREGLRRFGGSPYLWRKTRLDGPGGPSPSAGRPTLDRAPGCPPRPAQAGHGKSGTATAGFGPGTRPMHPPPCPCRLCPKGPDAFLFSHGRGGVSMGLQGLPGLARRTAVRVGFGEGNVQQGSSHHSRSPARPLAQRTNCLSAQLPRGHYMARYMT